MLVKRFQKAVTLYRNGDLSGAKAQCQKILGSSENFAPVIFLSACIARDEGHLDYAVTTFKKAIVADPGQYHFYVNLGDQYAELGRFSEAMSEYQQSLNYVDTPENEAIIFQKIGNIYRLTSELDAALNAYQQSITLAPKMAEAHTCAGIVYKDIGDLKSAEVAHRKAIELNASLSEAYNNLALVLVEDDRVKEGVETYQRLIELAPNFTLAYRNLGNALMILGEHDKALVALNHYIELAGEDCSVSHMINALMGRPTDTTPVEYIEKLFDGYASNFEEELVVKLEYKIPAIMIALLERYAILAKGRRHTVLDLGCGTGRVGDLLVGDCDAIDGVDLSQGMLNEAKAKGVYRHLIKGDIVDYLNRLTSPVRYSLIIAADVLIYIGSLEPLFQSLRNRDILSAGNHFVFSLENMSFSTLNRSRPSFDIISTVDDYQLLPSGRFSHSEHYIAKLCTKYQFRIVVIEQAMIRKERGEAIEGCIVVISECTIL